MTSPLSMIGFSVLCVFVANSLQCICGFQVSLASSRNIQPELRPALSYNRASTRVKKKSTTKSPTAVYSADEYNGGEPVFPDYLIEALDLVPLLFGVARHSGTRRGHQALLSLVKEDQKAVTSKLLSQTNSQQNSSRRQRAEGSFQREWTRKRSRIPLVTLAKSAPDARKQYELVEAATLALSKNSLNLTYPPLYGAESSPWDTSRIEDTDNDEWLWMPADVWSLENILQAEKVIETLLETKRWANEECTITWVPSLSEIGMRIDEDNILPDILKNCAGNVEIVRVRTLANPSGKASYSFRLKVDKYPVLRILREKEEQLLNSGAKELDKEMILLHEEIDDVEAQIRGGLAQMILNVADVVDTGLDLLGRLDVIFAQAAFGQKLNGVIPQISDTGKIVVANFIHPVLALSDGFSPAAKAGDAGHVVPIDLRLSSEKGQRALVISGPNGGGKTLSMKSFGLVCILKRMGIPIPTTNDSARPRVDFFGNVLINVGDKQDVMQGESTWTSLLNACARMIENVESNPDQSHLVLLDELGSGTDPDAGGAVAQAILEELMTTPGCRVVATTHSPRLKTLSYESDEFGCASVLLEMDSTTKFKKPTFRLEYGIIGESYALGAASRCTPPLAESVLSRAAQLLAEDSAEGKNIRGDYIQALAKSMEEQAQRMQEERLKAEEKTHDSHSCRQAMITLASSYEIHLQRLNERLEDCYRRLREDPDKNDLEVIGDSLAELRIAKKKLQSQQELLREKGLKLLSPSYKLSVGESVVIVGTDSEWDGATVQVLADATADNKLGPTEVLVGASQSFMAWNNMISSSDDQIDPNNAGVTVQPWVVQRHQLAIWDYDSMWEDHSSYDDPTTKATSIPDSKRRLSSLLSTLKSDSAPRVGLATGSTKPTKIETSFASARARKAANSGKKKK